MHGLEFQHVSRLSTYLQTWRVQGHLGIPGSFTGDSSLFSHHPTWKHMTSRKTGYSRTVLTEPVSKQATVSPLGYLFNKKYP